MADRVEVSIFVGTVRLGMVLLTMIRIGMVLLGSMGGARWFGVPFRNVPVVPSAMLVLVLIVLRECNERRRISSSSSSN